MNALLDGKVVPYEEALSKAKEWMKVRGISKPRMRIGQYYIPLRRPIIGADEYNLQSALLNREARYGRTNSA